MKGSESPLLERVARSIFRYSMWPASGTLGVAVSGGADSVCLLHVLRELAGPRPLAVLHVNHRFRGAESDADEAFVRELAATLQLPFEVHRPELRPGNAEEEARRARYRWFQTLMFRGGIARVATGHTEDDQAETVLFRLLRGTTTTGLRGIRRTTAEGVVRPLLDVPRSEVRTWLEERGLSWREDSSNSDLRFARNRIRHKLLPALASEGNHSVRSHLAHLAQMAEEEDSYLETSASKAAAVLLSNSPHGSVVDAGRVAALGPALARRLVRISLERSTGCVSHFEWRHLEAALALVLRSEGYGGIDLPGVRVERSLNWVRFVPDAAKRAENDKLSYTLTLLPGELATLPLHLGRVSLQTIDSAGNSYNGGSSCLDPRRAGVPLEIRNWQPGDRLVRNGTCWKLKDLFQQERIPIWERCGWPVATSEGRIVWARRFGVADDALPRVKGPLLRIVDELGSRRESV